MDKKAVSYRCFVDVSAPAVGVGVREGPWKRVLWEVLCVVLFTGLVALFMCCNSSQYVIQDTCKQKEFRQDDFRTGDILVVFHSYTGNHQDKHTILNPGHVYLVMELGRYQQRVLWDLTYWYKAQQFQSLHATVTNLQKKKVPLFVLHLHHPSAQHREELQRVCRAQICRLTYNLTYDSQALPEHIATSLENLAHLPGMRNPFVDITYSQKYCSLYVLKLLVQFGVLRKDVLVNIPFFNTETNTLQGTGGSLFYPCFLVMDDFHLNDFAINGWWYEEAKKLACGQTPAGTS